MEHPETKYFRWVDYAEAFPNKKRFLIIDPCVDAENVLSKHGDESFYRDMLEVSIPTFIQRGLEDEAEGVEKYAYSFK